MIALFLGLLMLGGLSSSAMALEYTQKQGYFKMNLPDGWKWVEFPNEVLVNYPDGKTVGIDIQFAPDVVKSPAEMKKTLEDSVGKMKTGVEAHNGKILNDKEMNLDGEYARRLDFVTSSPHAVYVSYIAFFHAGDVYTIIFGNPNPNDFNTLDAVAASFKFK